MFNYTLVQTEDLASLSTSTTTLLCDSKSLILSNNAGGCTAQVVISKLFLALRVLSGKQNVKVFCTVWNKKVILISY